VGNQYILHTKDNKVLTASGLWLKDFSRLATTPNLSEKEALDITLQGIGNEVSYAWEDSSWEAELKKTSNNDTASYYPVGDLLYMPDIENDKNNYVLAYKFNITLTSPYTSVNYYINAIDGTLLLKEKAIYDCTTPATGNSVYSGTVGFSVSGSGTHTLNSCSNINSVPIHTRNLQGGYSIGSAVDITQTDTFYDVLPHPNDFSGIDVHWGMERAYDFTLTNFSRNSFDDAGGDVNSYVRRGTGAQANNAFYNPNSGNPFFAFGGGDGTTGPWTTPDIVGHEWWHAVTDYTADLIYANESGALNEAFSDIFGELIEAYAQGTTVDWLIGDQLLTGEIRSMSNPNDFNHAKCYEGVYYISNCPTSSGFFSPYDHCGVHSNSGVANYWFFLLSQGGSGTNDAGESFTVAGQGNTIAMNIAYRALSLYMTSTNGFEDARQWTLQAAEDLYGACSPEYQACANAWHAVCVGNKYQGDLAPTDLTSSATNCNATLSWNDMVAQNYEYCYREVGTTAWTCATGGIPVTINGLSPNTDYEWRVRSICAGLSPWSTIATFTTLEACPNVDIISSVIEDITVCSANISWDANGAVGYNLRYRECGTTTWTITSLTTNTTSLSGLLPGVCYEVEVESDCECSTSGYIALNDFTTLTCPAATMTATASACKVTVTVDQIGPGSTATLSYRPLGSSGSTTTSLGELNLSRLRTFTTNPGTTYEYWVTTTCSGDGCSVQTVTPIQTITTPNLDPTCDAPTNFLIDVESLSGNPFVYWSAYWTPATNSSSYEAQFRYSSGASWINYGTTISNPEMHGGSTGISCYLEIRVRSICDCVNEGETSPWVTYLYDGDDFPCIDLEDYNTTPFCNGNIDLSTNPRYCADEYTWRYRQILPTVGTWTTVTTSGNDTTIAESSLNPNATYEWQVMLECADGTSFPWGPAQTFTTRGDCNIPDSLTSTQQDSSSTLLSWTPSGSSSTFYLVRWREVGTTTWMGPNTTASTNYLVSGLTTGVNYEWEVMAVCQDWSFCPATETDWNAGTFILEDDTDPCTLGVPNDLYCKTIKNEIQLNWSPVTNAIGYHVEILYNDPDCCPKATNPYGIIIPVNSGSQTSIQFTPAEKCFSWRVRAVCENNVFGKWSEKTCIDCFVTTDCDTTPPVNLDCKQVKDKIELSWDPVPGAIGYHVEILYNDPECCPKAGDPYGVIFPINTLGQTTLLFSPNEKCFSWRVRAICENNVFGEWSKKKCADCITDCSTEIPINLDCKQVKDKVELSWNPVPGAIGYHVEILYNDPECCPKLGDHYGVIFPINTLGQTTLLFSPNEKCFSWRVRAICESNVFGKWSKKKCADCIVDCTTEIPVNLNCKQIKDKIELSWDAVPGAIGYHVEILYNDPECCSKFGDTYGVIFPINTLGQTTLLFSPNEKCFSWKVRAICKDNVFGKWSKKKCSDCKTVCETTPPVELYCKVEKDQIKLYWNAVSGAIGYHVEIIYNDPECCSKLGDPYGVIFPINTLGQTTLSFSPNAKCYSWRVRAICKENIFGEWSKKSCADCLAKVTTTSSMDVNLYPNPGDRFLNIEMKSSSTSNVTITIANIVTLNTVYTNSIPAKSEHIHQVNVSALPSGVYLVTVKNDKEVISKKFVKK
jgi:Zn-dependent metalloprotease